MVTSSSTNLILKNSEQINRNIMVPMPYLLYVLEAGFADVGIGLTGEILNDTYYKKAVIYTLNDFYKSFTTQSETYSLNTDDYTILEGNRGTYNLDITLPEPGRYKIAGNVVVRAREGAGIYSQRFAAFSYNGSSVWNGIVVSVFDNYKEKFFTVDFDIDYTGTEGDVSFYSENLYYALVNGDVDLEAMLMDVTVTQLAKYDGNGDLVSTLVEATSIDLSKSVPDMTFGEFVFAVLKKRNYGYDIDGSVIAINKKNVNAVSTQNAVDLSDFEVMTPERNFNGGKSFVFKQFDFEHDEYKSQKILINNNGYQVNEFTKPDDAEEITVNALALPLKTFGIKTAHGFLDDFTKLQLVIYGGLTNSLNISEDPSEISHLNNYLDDYEAWFNFLMSSINYNWIFESSYEELAELKIRSIIYAYRQYHIIRKLSRKTFISQTNGIQLEYDIETETLP